MALSLGWHLLYRRWIAQRIAEDTIHWMGTSPVDSILFVSAFLVLLRIRWLSIALVVVNCLALFSNLYSVYLHCQEFSDARGLFGCYYFSGEMSDRVFWDITFWSIQIGLITYLSIREREKTSGTNLS